MTDPESSLEEMFLVRQELSLRTMASHGAEVLSRARRLLPGPTLAQDERLALIAAVTLPITALASVYGMDVIVNESTHAVQLVTVLTLMAICSGILLRWTKKRGWW
jgi:uncharacterized membrane protein